jgi:hypothetical protein
VDRPSGGDLDQDFFRDINQRRAELRVHRRGRLVLQV